MQSIKRVTMATADEKPGNKYFMLNDKQERFCDEYVVDLNGRQAAIRAGYSTNTAKETAYELLQKPDIKERIAELQAEITERNKLKADQVINELRSLAFWDIGDFLNTGNTIKDISTLDKQTRRPVISVKTKTDHFEGGSSTTTELKLADKRAALVDLGRHLGIFKEDNSQKVVKIRVTRK